MPYIKKHKKFRLSDDKQDEIVGKIRSISSY
jgi:hypothetical protein